MDNTGQLPRFDHILLSDRAAVDIGIFVLKVVTIVNAGALIALLATVGNFKDDKLVVASIADSAYPFYFGLLSAILAAGLSYIYQSLVTAHEWHEFYTHYPNADMPPPFPWAGKVARKIIIFVIALILVSFASFGCGAWLLTTSIAGLYIPS